MNATEAACLLELKRLTDSGLTPEEAVQRALAHNSHVAVLCHKMKKFDLEAVAHRRIRWYNEKLKESS